MNKENKAERTNKIYVGRSSNHSAQHSISLQIQVYSYFESRHVDSFVYIYIYINIEQVVVTSSFYNLFNQFLTYIDELLSATGWHALSQSFFKEINHSSFARCAQQQSECNPNAIQLMSITWMCSTVRDRAHRSGRVMIVAYSTLCNVHVYQRANAFGKSSSTWLYSSARIKEHLLTCNWAQHANAG